MFNANQYLELLFSKNTKQSAFIDAVLTEDIENAKKLGFELYNTCPFYLLFVCLLNEKENKAIILTLLKRMRRVEPQTIYHMASSSIFTHQEVSSLIKIPLGESFLDLCIKKELLLKKYNEKTEIEEATKELNDLLGHMSDFSLYDFAIKKGIEILCKNEDVNYKWYRIVKEGNIEIGKELIEKSTKFSEIKKIIDLCKIKTGTDCSQANNSNTIHCLVAEYLIHGYSQSLLEKSTVLLDIQNPSFLSLKLVLALLIASRDEKLLVLALFLSEKYTFQDNYEILLISLFLSRHFMLFGDIERKLNLLDVKNIQQHNLAYIWSDPMIIQGIRLPEKIEAFKREIHNEISESEGVLRRFIEEGLLISAVSTLNLRSRLRRSVIFEEINSKKLKCEENWTMFSDLLGDECRYLFDKATVTDIRTNEGTVFTLKTLPSANFTEEIFKNGYFEIETSFKDRFRRSVQKK